MSASAPYQPDPRWGHTSVTIGDRVFMWGGRIDDFSDSAKKEVRNVMMVCRCEWEECIHTRGVGKTNRVALHP